MTDPVLCIFFGFLYTRLLPVKPVRGKIHAAVCGEGSLARNSRNSESIGTSSPGTYGGPGSAWSFCLERHYV